MKRPEWMDGIRDKAKKICLLLGKWEEIEGDKLIVESLYGEAYENFIEEILPYTKVRILFFMSLKAITETALYSIVWPVRKIRGNAWTYR